ncbi:MAG: TrkH family potassium uptake protein [Sphaerochaetaceae bacterium]
MNYKQIFHLLATILLVISFFMLIPALYALFLNQKAVFNSFLIPLIIIALYVISVFLVGRSWEKEALTTKEIYFFVILTYLFVTTIGSLPFYLSGSARDFSSAFMETMSGFSTTGLSNLENIEGIAKPILLWRSMTHWLGGMGIVVLFVALLPLMGTEGSQLYSAEVVGPNKNRLTPKIRDSALILWLIYIFLTLAEIVLLLFGKLPFFDALTLSLSTVATGGFVAREFSVSSYSSAYVDYVVTVFMIMGGINFTLYYSLIKRKFSRIKTNDEIKVYLAIFCCAAAIVVFSLLKESVYPTFEQAFRYGVFHVASILSTTGFYITNFNSWPFLAQGVLLTLMFVGGSSGSTSGGIKVSRIITMFKLAKQNVKVMLHPKGHFTIQSEHERIPWRTVNAIAGFITIYLFLVLLTTLVVASAGYDLTTSFSTGLISVGNFGLGFRGIGPHGIAFVLMPKYVKWFLSFMMLGGRLEIYSLIILFSTRFWKK